MRRRRMWTVVTLFVVGCLLWAGCTPAATPTPQVIVKRETEVVTIRETVVVPPTPVPPPPRQGRGACFSAVWAALRPQTASQNRTPFPRG